MLNKGTGLWGGGVRVGEGGGVKIRDFSTLLVSYEPTHTSHQHLLRSCTLQKLEVSTKLQPAWVQIWRRVQTLSRVSRKLQKIISEGSRPKWTSHKEQESSVVCLQTLGVETVVLHQCQCWSLGLGLRLKLQFRWSFGLRLRLGLVWTLVGWLRLRLGLRLQCLLSKV